MDLQKHKFWVVVGAIAALEFGGLAYCMLSIDADISKQSKGIDLLAKELEKSSKLDAIPNDKDAIESGQRKKQTAQNYVRTLFYFAQRDEMALGGKWVDAGKVIDDVPDLKPQYETRTADMKNKMINAADPYAGLIIKDATDPQGRPLFPVKFPLLPTEKAGIPAFYRDWWVLEMALLHIIAPTAKTAADAMSEEDRPLGRWELLELEVMTHEQPPTKHYFNELIPVRMRLKMQHAHLKALMQASFNSPFLSTPMAVGAWTAANDPEGIKIVVKPGDQKPGPEEQDRLASKKQPKIIVEIILNVLDLDEQKLLDQARAHKDKIGTDRSDFEAFVKELDTDDFCKAQTGFDRKAFLNRMVDKLMAPR